MNNVTLNDFRSLLGKVNDGNIVFKTGAGGSEKLGKVNYGRVFKHEKTPNSAEMNNRVRAALLGAVVRSAEGQSLSAKEIGVISRYLGLDGDSQKNFDKPLDRRNLAAVLNFIDNRATFDAMLNAQHKILSGKGLILPTLEQGVRRVLEGTRDFATAEAMVLKLIGPGKGASFNGFSKEEMEKFVNGNLRSIQAHLFDKLYVKGYDVTAGGRLQLDDDLIKDVASNPGKLLREVVTEMMEAYGRHEEPGFELDKLRGQAERRFFDVPLEQDVADRLGSDFGKADEVFKTLMPGNASNDFQSLRLARLNRFLLSTIKMACNQAYLDGHNDLQQAENCLQALFQQCGLDKITADDLCRACEDAHEPTVVQRFQEAFLANVERLGDIDLIPPKRILAAAGEALRAIAESADLERVLANHIAEKTLPGESKELCLKLARQTLADSEVTEELRSEVRIALLKGDEKALNPLMDALTRAVAQRGQSAEYVKDRFVELSKMTTGEKGELNWLKLPEQEDEFCGKVVALLLLKGFDALAEKGIVNSKTSQFVNNEDSRAAVEEMMRSVTLEAVDSAYHYFDKGAYAQDIYISAMGAEKPFFDGLRDGVLSVREMTKEFAVVLRDLRERYLAREEGEPDGWPAPLPTSGDDFKNAFEALLKDVAKDEDEAKWIRQKGDLGTGDIGTMLKLLKNAGLSPKDIGTPEGFLRLQYLTRFVERKGSCDGVLEFAERLGGKSFADMTTRELATALRVAGDDPLSRLADAPGDGSKFKTVSDYLQGTLTTREADLLPAELGALLKGLRALATAQPGATQTVFLLGVEVRLVKTPTDDLKAVVTAPVGPKGENRPVALRVPRDASAFAILIENEIAAQAANLDRATLESILPAADDPTAILSRTRELCAKIICVKLRVSLVSLSGLEVAQLREMALRAVAGELKAADLPKELPQGYNSQEAIELRRAYVKAPRTETDTILMPPVPETRTRLQRETLPPTDGAVRDFLADLLMNKETWFFDGAQGYQTGERIRKVLVSWGPELKFILKDVDAALANVPPVAREELRVILDEIQKLGNPEQASVEKCAALETFVAHCADRILEHLQVSVKNLFDAKIGSDKKDWEKSLDELSGGNGLDLSTPNGRFVRKALESYFVKSGPIEKRAMLSAFLRNTDGASTEAKQVAELLKGAGPILQKMLQGLPLESFGPETQVALQDMKSKLPSIPEEVIRAQLFELKRASGGAITSIELIRSIGAATVGQALLCRIKTKEHPVTGEEVVIKLLRPNVINAAQREYAFFMDLAQEQGEGMPDVFQAQYDGILEEMDFTHEAENVDLGVRAYNRPTGSDGTTHENVRSLDRHPAVLPLTGALVLTKVEGETFDGFIRSAQRKILEVSGVRPFGLPDSEEVRPQAPVNSVGELRRRRHELTLVRNQALARRNLVMKFADAWLNEALLGSGFLHGDLHAGNLMTDGKNVSVIDYGNARRLTEEQQKGILRMMTSSMAGGAADFLKALQQMLPVEARTQLATADAQGALTAALNEVLTRGTTLDGVSRLAAALTCVQRAGVGVPPSVTCFIQSLTRLKAVVSGLDDVIREAESTIGTVTVQLPPERPKLLRQIVVGGLDLDATIEECLPLLNGTGTSGPDSASLSVKNGQLQKVLEDVDAAQRQIRETLAAAGPEMVESFLDRYALFMSYYDTTRKVGKSTFLVDIENALNSLKANSDPAAEAELYASIANSIVHYYREVGAAMCQSAQRDSKVADLESFEELACQTVTVDLGKTIKKMTGKDVDMNQNELALGASIMLAFVSTGGTFGVPSLKGGVNTARENRKQFASCLESAKARHGARPPELRVRPRLQLALDEIARDVRLPKHKMPAATEVEDLVAMLLANLKAARAAYKTLGGENEFALGETMYLADVLNAGTNGELARVIKSAPDNEMRSRLTQEGADAVALYEALKELKLT